MSFSTDSYLRRAEREDLDTVVTWMEDEDFQHFLYGDPARSPKQIREQIVSMLGRSVGHTMPGGLYLLIDSPTQGPLGMISLQKISWRNRSCSLDFYLGVKGMRNHMMTAIAVYRALEYCFDELNLHRVSAFIYAFNTASWRIFEMAGAQRELVLENHVFRKGVWHSVYGYGLLQREFEAARQKNYRLESVSLQNMIAQLKAQESENAPETSGASETHEASAGDEALSR